MKRIALIVDHPQRDLPGIALVASFLAARGCQSYLIPMNLFFSEAFRDIWSLHPDFVLLPHLRKSNAYIAKQFRMARIPVGVLETEGLVRKSDLFSRVLPPRADREYVDFFCCWGPEFRELLDGQFRPEQLKMTGVPRFDFYHPQWNPGTNVKKDAVLICSNFTMANARFADPVKERELYLKVFHYKEEELDRLVHLENKALKEFVSLTLALARKYPATKMIFRPHPFENIQTYRKHFDALPNIEIDTQGVIGDALSRSQLLIHTNSTSCFDAWLSETPALMPSYVERSNRLDRVAEMSIPAASEEEVVALTGKILKEEFEIEDHLKKRVQQEIDHLFFKTDGNSAQRVASLIMETLEKSPSGNPYKIASFSFAPTTTGSWLHRFGGRLRALLAMLGLTALSSDFSMKPEQREKIEGLINSDKRFTATQVKAALDKLASLVSYPLETTVVENAAHPRDFKYGSLLDGQIIVVKGLAKSNRIEEAA